jgi:phosphatidylglycerol lysyltransferase
MIAIVFLVFSIFTANCAAQVPQTLAVQQDLRRGPFDTFHFVPDGAPRAIVLFGSGDGGWGYLENKICTFLKANGFYVVGIDCRRYAESDYDGPTLAGDFAAIAADALRRSGHPELRVIYGGWSMGAVQAVAASASEHRCPLLMGLLLMSMDKRGRYGLRLTDQIGFAPTGDGTFAIADFTSWIVNLRIIQYEAIGDWMNNVEWIRTLQTPHRLYELPRSNHDFNGANEQFRQKLLEGLAWMLEQTPPKGAGKSKS